MLKRSDADIKVAAKAWCEDAEAAREIYGPISIWNTSEVTNMEELFCASTAADCSYDNPLAASFNEDISAWDTSGVTTMNGMFSKTSSFNQPIGAWDTSGVRRMDWMFVGSAFNQPIGD